MMLIKTCSSGYCLFALGGEDGKKNHEYIHGLEKRM
jgi:hypothetical protein